MEEILGVNYCWYKGWLLELFLNAMLLFICLCSIVLVAVICRTLCSSLSFSECGPYFNKAIEKKIAEKKKEIMGEAVKNLYCRHQSLWQKDLVPQFSTHDVTYMLHTKLQIWMNAILIKMICMSMTLIISYKKKSNIIYASKNDGHSNTFSLLFLFSSIILLI